MICKQARYNRFRNILNSQIVFSEGINIICGDNAQGKTNAIEGIYLCAQGRSHRTVHEKEYINFDSDWATVGISYKDKNRDNEISMGWSTVGKRYCEINKVPINKMSDFIGNFRAVIFTPEHLSIIKDGPSKRRTFIDSAISQLDSGYVRSLQKYNKILMQRNKLLAEAARDKSIYETINLWSEQLAGEAAVISMKREKYIEKLGKFVFDIFSDMTEGREIPELKYPYRMEKEQYIKLLKNNLEREIRYGTTLYGTHKDDIEIFLNNSEARNYASQGQQRSLSLSMKLAEGEISKEECGEYPVFLFDDVLSELDEKRKNYITNKLSGRQVIITTCENGYLSKISPGNKIIYAKNGTYLE